MSGGGEQRWDRGSMLFGSEPKKRDLAGVCVLCVCSMRRAVEVYRGHDLVRMRHRLIGVMIRL